MPTEKDKGNVRVQRFGIVHAVILHSNGGRWVQVSEILLPTHATFQFSVFLVKQERAGN